MTISKDRVKPSPMPDSWKLKEIFATGVVFGTYLAVMSVIFFWAMKDTDFFSVSILFSFIGVLTLIHTVSLLSVEIFRALYFCKQGHVDIKCIWH